MDTPRQNKAAITILMNNRFLLLAGCWVIVCSTSEIPSGKCRGDDLLLPEQRHTV
jgi:hypothetical protein